jgi:hypothetical protein
VALKGGLMKVVIWFVLLFALISCQPTPETQIGEQSPQVGRIVPVGEPVQIDLRPTTERIPNCSGSQSTISKTPSMTIISGHSVEWEVGGQAGVGIKIGEGVLPFGVDLSSALTGIIAEGINQGFSQTSSWNLSAAPGEVVDYTLTWWEIWQPGYIDVTMADQQIVRINVRYRSGVGSDLETQAAFPCDGISGDFSETVSDDSSSSELKDLPTRQTESRESLIITDYARGIESGFAPPTETNPPTGGNLHEICGKVYFETGNSEKTYGLDVPQNWAVMFVSIQEPSVAYR